MRPCIKRHFFKKNACGQTKIALLLFYQIDTEVIASSLQSIAAFCNGGDCWQPLKLFSYLLFSTVYLTFEQFVTVLAQREKSTLANVCLGVRFGSQVCYLGSKKFKVLPCEIFGIFCVINPSRSFGKIQLKT